MVDTYRVNGNRQGRYSIGETDPTREQERERGGRERKETENKKHQGTRQSDCEMCIREGRRYRYGRVLHSKGTVISIPGASCINLT